MTTLGRVFSAGAALVLVGALNYCGDSNSDPGFTGAPDLALPDQTPSGLTLTLAVPASALNTGGVTMGLTGSGFLTGATVTIGGVPATGVVVSSPTEITCTLPAKLRTCGPVPIVVTNPNNQMVSAATLFSYKTGSFGLMAAQTTTANSAPMAGNLVAGDLNGDGKPDLVVVNLGVAGTASTLSTLLGQGGAAFGNVMTTPVGISPLGLVAVDLDGDKKLDVLVANSGSNSFNPLLGMGNGSFTIKGPYNSGIVANSVAVGDFNGDTRLDVAIGSVGTTKGAVTIFLGNGDGTFKTPPTTAQTGTATNSVIASDVTGDGILDLITASDTGIDLLVGTGTGTFAASMPFLVGTRVLGIGAGDFDGNGRSDVFAIYTGTNNLSVLISSGGAGVFAAARVVPSGGLTPLGAIATDLNGDGKTDLMTANSASGDVSLLLGQGNGNFATAQVFAVGTNPRSLVTTDFNGDGGPDLAIANAGSNNVSVLLSQCN